MKPIEGYEFWTFRTDYFEVVAIACEEHIHPRDSFQFQEDIDLALSGNLHDWFCAVVEVRTIHGRIIGRDVLGGCSYSSFKDFTAPGSGYFRDMVRSAVTEARDTLAREIAA